MKIKLNILGNKSNIGENVKIIKKAISIAVKNNKIISKCDECEINLEFVQGQKIKEINKEYRNKDSITDVLSFPMFERDELVDMKFSHIILGDIFVCLERVKEQSEEYGHSFDRELLYMVIHGILHLLGYDHENEKDKKIMREEEEKVLDIIELKR